MADIPLQPFIHGEYKDALSPERLSLYSAVDDALVTDKLQCAGAADVDAAVESAAKALPVWQGLPPSERRRIMIKFADLVDENAKRLAELEVIITGKSGLYGSYETSAVSDSFRCMSFQEVDEHGKTALTKADYSGFVDKLEGEYLPTNDGVIRLVRHEPLGICAAIIPFNSPLITLAMKAAPALCMGNVMIVKASEYNPLSTVLLGELAMQAGFPAGTLNILVGTLEAGAALSSHMKIRKISFTGSVGAGRQIQIAAARSNLKRVTLELGGKSPVLIFPDADLALAVKNCMSFTMFNGQGCIIGTRIFVHESIVDAFLEHFKAAVGHVISTLGADPRAPDTMSCPIFHTAQKKRVLEFIERGKQEAQLLVGGKAHGDKGCYIEPTIFYKPSKGAYVSREEAFGPIVVVDTFSTEQEAIDAANDTEFGLGAYVYTSDVSRLHRVADAIDAGTVCLNSVAAMHVSTPFNGHKASGIGTEGGKHVLREYSQLKTIVLE